MATKENKVVTLPAHIRVRRDTLANWTSINPVLDDGELAIVRMPDGSITMRVGTGADSFKNLPDISNSDADEIHVLDSVTVVQQTGTLSTSDYELCANNHVIGVKTDNTEDAQVTLLYKLSEYSGNYLFGVFSEETVVTVVVQASKEYAMTGTAIPSSLIAAGNTVKMNDTTTGVTFDLTKDGSGKVQIALNGAAVGTGITLPGHAIADIEGLQTALDGKANATHTHVHTDVTDFDTSVDSRIDAKLDSLPEVTIPEYTLQSGSAEGTVALYKDGVGSDAKVNGFDNLKTQVSGKYSKPSGGIPKTDLASDVQASLGKADTALQTAPEYTLEKSGEEVSLKKDGTVVGDPIAIASNKGKLLDYDGNEIFNADQSEDVKMILFDCGDSTLPTLQTPVLISQEDGEKTSTITISNPNSVAVEL